MLRVVPTTVLFAYALASGGCALSPVVEVLYQRREASHRLTTRVRFVRGARPLATSAPVESPPRLRFSRAPCRIREACLWQARQEALVLRRLSATSEGERR